MSELDARLESLNRKARSAEAAGDYDTALELSAELRRLRPENPNGWFVAINVLRRLGRLQELEDLLAGANERIFFDYGIMSIWVSLPRIRREWHEALRRSQMMIDRYPDKSKGYHHAIYAIDCLHGYEAALKEIEVLLERFPDDHDIIGPAADVAMHREDWQRAASLWQHFHRLLPNDPGRRRSWILSLMRVGDLQSCDSLCIKSVEDFPADPHIALLWAEIAMQRSEWSVSVERWTVLRTRFPHLNEPYVHAAHALCELGRNTEAEELLSLRPAGIAFGGGSPPEGSPQSGPPASSVESVHQLMPSTKAASRIGFGDPLTTASPDPSKPLLKVNWSEAVLSELRREIESRGKDSREFAIANIRMDIARGDFVSVRQGLQDFLNRFASLYPQDGYTFEAVLTTAVLGSQWDLARRFLNDRFGAEWCADVTAERTKIGGQVVRWIIDQDGRSRFAFDPMMIQRDRAWPETLQFNRTASLFYGFSASGHKEHGSVVVNLGDSGVVPGLAFCEYRPEYYLVPDPVFLNTRAYADIKAAMDAAHVPWDQRLPIGFWRGSTTGQRRGTDWRSMPRIRLCLIGKSSSAANMMDVGITNVTGMPPEMTAEVRAAGLCAPSVKRADFMKFKYQIDVDGNTNAWAGLFEKLYTGSPVLKVSSPLNYRQWYYGELKPWWNYVPVAADMSDLTDKISWLRSHDGEARIIGERGRALAASMTHAAEIEKVRSTINAAILHFVHLDGA